MGTRDCARIRDQNSFGGMGLRAGREMDSAPQSDSSRVFEIPPRLVAGTVLACEDVVEEGAKMAGDQVK